MVLPICSATLTVKPESGEFGWVRSTPSLIKESFVDRIATLPTLAPHFHLSLQSGADHVLHLMRRPYSAAMARAAVERLRAAFPQLGLTADVIVGFPQETETDFAETTAFLRESRFLDAHIFAYSRRPGTEAAAMPGQIDEAVKHAGSSSLIAAQAELHRELLDKAISSGQILPVLFETWHNGWAQGHTPTFYEVRIKADHDLRGMELPVKPVGQDGQVLIGEACGQDVPPKHD